MNARTETPLQGPTWKTHLVLFGLLIGVVCAYFYWQVDRARQSFEGYVVQSTRIIAGVIERNARSVQLSQTVIEEIMETFLGNMARFVDYLDSVEPFSANELAAFAVEAGLAGIHIEPTAGPATQGPAGWVPASRPACTPSAAGLHRAPDAPLYYLAQPRRRRSGCIVVGVSSARLEALQEQIGLPVLLQTIGRLPGIRYVRLDPLLPAPRSPAGAQPAVRLQGPRERRIAHIELALADKLLVVGLDATLLARAEAALWREFFIFAALLAALGLALSALLHRLQTGHLAQVRRFERRLAREHEDATLGRATGAIAHEVKNPLNAIAMGLQRLQMEAEALDDEQRQLLDSMRAAVDRADTIIGGLRRYARPLQPQPATLRPADMFARVRPLYEGRLREAGIDLTVDDRFAGTLTGDPTLLEEVIDNLLRNAIEAQPAGGDIRITTRREGSWAVFGMENGGCTCTAAQTARMLDPYFTTKTRGSGLGLPVAVRIVQAHGGRLDLALARPGRLRVTVRLPLGSAPYAEKTTP